MGEFSYTQADDTSEVFGEFNASYDSFGSYQDEVAALVPENVPMLAAILMEQGVIDNAGVNTALARQAESGDTLVQVLLDAGLAAPDQLVMALQTRANYR
ncbi:MAG: hypothetical protein JWM80_3368 [Cyanobacteria bacterium RYN_339]|nr:hypothetical protein [Cyanobacteria bacterium RYN_339]